MKNINITFRNFNNLQKKNVVGYIGYKLITYNVALTFNINNVTSCSDVVSIKNKEHLKIKI